MRNKLSFVRKRWISLPRSNKSRKPLKVLFPTNLALSPEQTFQSRERPSGPLLIWTETSRSKFLKTQLYKFRLSVTILVLWKLQDKATWMSHWRKIHKSWMKWSWSVTVRKRKWTWPVRSPLFRQITLRQSRFPISPMRWQDVCRVFSLTINPVCRVYLPRSRSVASIHPTIQIRLTSSTALFVKKQTSMLWIRTRSRTFPYWKTQHPLPFTALVPLTAWLSFRQNAVKIKSLSLAIQVYSERTVQPAHRKWWTLMTGLYIWITNSCIMASRKQIPATTQPTNKNTSKHTVQTGSTSLGKTRLRHSTT